MEQLDLDYKFSALSLKTGEVVEGYHLKLDGNDFIITPEGIEHLVESSTLKLVHNSVESLAKSINDTLDDNASIDSALVLFDVKEGPDHATIGVARATQKKSCADVVRLGI